jgi:hypothetical protein
VLLLSNRPDELDAMSDFDGFTFSIAHAPQVILHPDDLPPPIIAEFEGPVDCASGSWARRSVRSESAG